MENIETVSIASIVVITIGFLWTAIPMLLFFIDLLIGFWSRNRTESKLASRFQTFKYGETSDSLERWLWVDVLCCVFTIVVSVIVIEEFQLAGILTVAAIVGIVLVPRYIADIANAIKYSFKKRESESMIALEKNIRDLNEKLEKHYSDLQNQRKGK